ATDRYPCRPPCRHPRFEPIDELPRRIRTKSVQLLLEIPIAVLPEGSQSTSLVLRVYLYTGAEPGPLQASSSSDRDEDVDRAVVSRDALPEVVDLDGFPARSDDRRDRLPGDGQAARTERSDSRCPVRRRDQAGS